jgi:hypothetical protein
VRRLDPTYSKLLAEIGVPGDEWFEWNVIATPTIRR